MRLSYVVLALVTMTFSRCGTTPKYESPDSYFSTVEQIVIEVAAEPSAMPYFGTIPTGLFAGTNYWDILKANIEALFEGRPTHVSATVPHSSSEITAIPAQNRATWTSDQILSLASQYKKQASTAKQAAFFVVFLDGYFEENGAQPGVIGVTLSGTPVIAIFKDVIVSSGGTVTRVFVEQSTLIHEFGHAVGLLNGVPLTSPHEDPAHPGHCNDPNCVMYWLNEGTSDLVTFIQQVMSAGNLIMYTDSCLQDTRSY